jgi:hypothetical protein
MRPVGRAARAAEADGAKAGLAREQVVCTAGGLLRGINLFPGDAN